MALFSAPSACSFQLSGLGNVGTRRHQNIQSMRLASAVQKAKQPGTAKLDTPWEELGFEFRPTNSHVRITYKDGEWGKPEHVKVSVMFAPKRALERHTTSTRHDHSALEFVSLKTDGFHFISSLVILLGSLR